MRGITTLVMVVALIGTTCSSSSETINTTTTTIYEWTQQDLNSVILYCESTVPNVSCATATIGFRDSGCSPEAVYQIIDILGLDATVESKAAAFIELQTEILKKR